MSKYCRGRCFTFEAASISYAPIGDIHCAVYVCGQCGKISHAVQEVYTVARGPKDAEFCASTHGLQNGQFIKTWVTPRGRIQTVEFATYVRKNPLDTRTDPLIYTCWNMLMDKVKEQLDPTTPVEVKGKLRHEARGMAELIAVLMYPHMESVQDVAMAARQKFEDPMYEVPGLGEHLFDANYNPDGSLRVKVGTPKEKPVAAPKKRAPSKSEKQLTPEEIDGIRSALDSGMFSKDDVASMFKVSMPDLEKALVDTGVKSE